MRLNRYLAAAGEGSRRSCEALILSGQVSINGVVTTNLATQVKPDDVVKVRNRVLHLARPVTLLLHKPPGYLCTASDTHDRRTIFDLLPSNLPRLFHVGRLDKESEGLLLVTNDGELALKLTHPRYKVEKEYEVVLNTAFDFSLAERLTHGIMTPEGRAYAESVHRLAANKVKMVLRQGLKRQIRLMFYELGYEVKKLVRTRIGPLRMGHLLPGMWRELSAKEIEQLLAAGQAKASRTPKPSAPKSAAGPAKAPRANKPFASKSAAKPRATGGSRPHSSQKGAPRRRR